MQKFLKRFFACLTSLLVLTSFLALQAGADTSTLGTQSPAITAAYFTDQELTNQVDGNALTSGESYYMVLSVSDLSSVSQLQFTAEYDTDVLQFGTVTVLPDISEGFESITPVAAAGRFIFGFVSTDSENTALADDSAVLAIAQITIASGLDSDVDVEDAITVNTNPNYTFIEVAYSDIAYDSAGNRVYSCYALADSEDFTGTAYTTLTCDLSPEVNFGYTVSAYIGALAKPTDTYGSYATTGAVVTISVGGADVSATTDENGRFVFTGVPSGTYTATVTYDYGFERTFTIVVDGADVASDTMVGIVGCNWDGNETINPLDVTEYLKVAGASSTDAKYIVGIDVDRSNAINPLDVTNYLAFSGKSPATMTYAETTIS